MIEVINLKKKYGIVEALRGISFSVKGGEIVGFLGPNGAGKTTCLKIITGYISPTAGDVFVNGLDVFEHSLEVRKKIGYLPENAPLYTDISVNEYLNYVSDIRGLRKNEKIKRINEISEICGLKEVMWRAIGTLSKGYRQRVGLSQAMIHNPDILILDEPTSGLDPNQIVEIRELIKEIGKKRTVILSTHNLPEVRATCNRLVIIHKGLISADGTPQEIEKKWEKEGSFVLKIDNKSGNLEQFAVREKISSIKGVTNVIGDTSDGITTFKIEAKEGSDIRKDLFKICVDNGLSLLELRKDSLDLEGIFRRITME